MIVAGKTFAKGLTEGKGGGDRGGVDEGGVLDGAEGLNEKRILRGGRFYSDKASWQ